MPLELTPQSESSEALTPLPEFEQVAGYTRPSLYPSAATYPSAAGTYPSTGSTVAAVGLYLDALPED